MHLVLPATLLMLASPLLSHPLDHLATRSAPETVYLSNCNEFEPGIQYSETDYYAADHDSQNQERADDTCGLFENNGPVTWEGIPRRCTFSDSGVAFTSNIAGNGQSVATFAKAGTASNGFKNFNCFKDSQRTLYTATGIIYKSIYYCLDA